jgi:hypothetical protein
MATSINPEETRSQQKTGTMKEAVFEISFGIGSGSLEWRTRG